MFTQEDVFIEVIVKRKKTAKDYLIIAGLVLAFIVLMLIALRFITYTLTFLPIIFAGGIFGLYYLITNLDREFEYICTNGHLDIDMIIHKRRRKRQVSMPAKDMEILAPVTDDEYKVQQRNQSLKEMNLTTNTGPDGVWFFVGTYKGQRLLVTSKVKFNMIQGL